MEKLLWSKFGGISAQDFSLQVEGDFESIQVVGESLRMLSRVTCSVRIKKGLWPALVCDRRWLWVRFLLRPQLAQHGRHGIWRADFVNVEQFTFTTRAAHPIDGEHSFSERCPVEPGSSVLLWLWLGLGLAKHIKNAALRLQDLRAHRGYSLRLQSVRQGIFRVVTIHSSSLGHDTLTHFRRGAKRTTIDRVSPCGGAFSPKPAHQLGTAVRARRNPSVSARFVAAEGTRDAARDKLPPPPYDPPRVLR